MPHDLKFNRSPFRFNNVNKSKVSNGNTNVNSKLFFFKLRKQEQSATVLKVNFFCNFCSERYHCLKPLLLDYSISDAPIHYNCHIGPILQN